MTSLRASNKDTVTFVVKRSVKRYLQEGKRYFDSGNIPRAIESYQRALDVDPGCALTHFNLGFAYHEEHHFPEARDSYRRAIDLMPDCSLFYEHMARLSFEEENYDNAIELFSHAIELGDVQPISYGLLGRAHYETGNHTLAATSLEAMLREESHPPLVAVARYHLTLAYLRLGRLAAARRSATALLAAESVDPQLLYDLGERFVRAKCISIARRLFERVILHAEERLHARKRYEEILTIDRKVDEILPKLASNDEEQILRVLHVLLNVGSDRVAESIGVLVHSPSALVREVAAGYHERYGYALPENTVQDLLHDPTGFVRERAAAYVTSLQPANSGEWMLPLLEDKVLDVRRQVAAYFRNCGTIEHLRALEEAASNEEHGETRVELRLAAEAIKQRYVEKVQDLARKKSEGMPDDTSPWLRWVAAGAAGMSLVYVIYWLIRSAHS